MKVSASQDLCVYEKHLCFNTKRVTCAADKFMSMSSMSMTFMPSQVHVFGLNERMCFFKGACSFCECARLRVHERTSLCNYNCVNICTVIQKEGTQE